MPGHSPESVGGPMTEQPKQPQQVSPAKYMETQINLVNQNLAQAIPNTAKADPKLMVAAAAVQAQVAVACALAEVAGAIREGNAPGQSIRYGLADLTKAVEL